MKLGSLQMVRVGDLLRCHYTLEHNDELLIVFEQLVVSLLVRYLSLVDDALLSQRIDEEG